MKSISCITCLIVTIILLLVVCCCLLAIVGVGGSWVDKPASLATAVGKLPFTFESTPAPSPVLMMTPMPAGNTSLDVLEKTIVPTSDLRDLARRLEGKENIPIVLNPPSSFPKMGDVKSFWLTNMDSDNTFQVKATLREVGDNVYFWVQNGLSYDKKELKKLVDAFDKKIYPTDREFFGEEFKPGIDGDNRIYMLLARGLGSTIAAYFSSVDSYSALAHKYSNEHEMIFLNADNIKLGEEFTYGVLAHEFQHMIHWNQDRNEETWLNEGFSELASFLNGYGTGSFEYAFVSNPDHQLTYWPGGDADTSPYYGAAFLYTNYFLGRFGEKATQALVSNQSNGMVSVSEVLQELNARDPQTGKQLTAEDVFLDWAIATYLNNPHVDDGRYAYSEYKDVPRSSETETIEECPTSMQTYDVHQYGVDIIRIACRGKYQLRFEGTQQVKVLPLDMPKGLYAFWSNRGDESDMTLTRKFDFREVKDPITLTYSMWYDLEQNYDYVYLLASEDGERWEIIKTPSGTAEDPSGNSYGWGYNGSSGKGPRWVEEKVDLSAYAGKEIYLRFEYVTDAAVNGEGFLIDNISIPAVGYSTDFEKDDGGWVADGFVRLANVLPQKFRLALIKEKPLPVVEELTLKSDNSLSVPLNLKEDAILVIAATSQYTNQKAGYRLQIQD